MGITDPAETYFKDGLWGWASTLWEKLVSSGGRLYTAPHGYYGTAWQKLAMVWGFSGHWSEYESQTASGAGDKGLTFSVAPAGSARVMLGMCAFNNTTQNAQTYLQVLGGTDTITLNVEVSPPAKQSVNAHVPYVLVNPLYLRAWFEDCLDGDTLQASAWGYDMVLTN